MRNCIRHLAWASLVYGLFLSRTVPPAAAISPSAQLLLATEQAECICEATITDSTYSRIDDFVWTIWNAQVERVLKGGLAVPGPVRLATMGGAIGDTSWIVSDGLPYVFGRKYMLFLSRCLEPPYFTETRRNTSAIIRGDQAELRFARATLPASSLRDSVYRILERVSPGVLAAGTALTVRARLLDQKLNSAKGGPLFGSTLHLQVDSVLVNHGNQRLREGDTLSAIVPSVISPGSLAGTVPYIPSGVPLYVMLNRVNGIWTFPPTCYAVWEIASDSCHVNCIRYGCPSRSWASIASMPMAEIQAQLRSR